MKTVKNGIGLAALGAIVFACSAGAEDSLETMENELSFERRSLWWPAVPAIDFTGILFCYSGDFGSDPKYATFRRAVTDAAKEWEAATDGRLRLTPINKCGSGIKIFAEKMDAGGSTKIGMNSEPIRVNRNYVNDYAIVKDVTLHEFGHKLGFTHEQVHPDSSCPKRQKDTFLLWEFETDTVGYSPFPYDANSVMNYCQPSGLGLSPSDIDAVQRLYGGNEYNLSDGRSFWLRSDHGQFYNPGFGFSPELKTRFKFANVGRPGQDVRYGHQVTIRDDSGRYLRASTTTNPKSGAVSHHIGLSDSPFNWDVSGFGSGAVGVNEPVAFSGLVGTQRLYLASSLTVKTGVQSLGVARRAETQPPQDSSYIWRILGPGPETKAVCGSGASRCGNNCCGAGIKCVDAAIGLCCGPFDSRCGNTCCGPMEECVAGACQIPAPTPQTPGTSCTGGAPSCSAFADCPLTYDYCGSGCCRRLR